MKSINRRGFLKKSAITTAGLAAGASAVKAGYAVKSPNDTINVAVVGIRSRGGDYNGNGHYATLSKIPNVRVTTLCDVDENLFPDGVANVEKMSGFRPKTEVDIRKVLEDKDIDAVSIASPDHWHALHTIWSCQAGKDVYLEKPISYNLTEGRKMVQAARKYNRVVQTGTQSRSSRVVHEAIKFLREGKLGDIYMGRSIVYGHRANIGRIKDSPIPEGVNWDMFLGPAPYRPFNKNRFHYNWHWYWDTSTSELGNNGTHSVDRLRWGMNKRTHPVEVECMGDFFVWDSDQEIPNLQTAMFRYDDGTFIQMEVRSLFTNAEAGLKSGSFFYGSEGWMQLGHTEFKTFFGTKDEPGPSMSSDDLVPKFEGLDVPHFTNFIDCMRSRRWQDLNADILEGHLSTSMAHIGNIAYRTGRKLKFNPTAEKFIDDDDANSYLTRTGRYPYILPDEV